VSWLDRLHWLDWMDWLDSLVDGVNSLDRVECVEGVDSLDRVDRLDSVDRVQSLDRVVDCAGQDSVDWTQVTVHSVDRVEGAVGDGVVGGVGSDPQRGGNWGTGSCKEGRLAWAGGWPCGGRGLQEGGVVTCRSSWESRVKGGWEGRISSKGMERLRAVLLLLGNDDTLRRLLQGWKCWLGLLDWLDWSWCWAEN